jgi:hypothetical protein
MNLGGQGCFVDVQAFFPISTFSTSTNAPEAAAGIACQPAAEGVAR